MRIRKAQKQLDIIHTPGKMPGGNRVLHSVLALCFMTLLISCKKSGLFFSAGPVRTVSVTPGDFNEIELYDKVNLVLTYDSIASVSVEAGENLLAAIETNVVDGKLVIRDNNKLKWTRDLDYTVTVYVHSTRLETITYNGAGNITGTNTWRAKHFRMDSFTGIGSVDLRLECESTDLFIRMANADFRVTGNSALTTMYCADYGSMDLTGFESRQMYLDYRSIRNSTINVSYNLFAKMLYKGNVYYYGNPELKVTYESSGLLIPLR